MPAKHCVDLSELPSFIGFIPLYGGHDAARLHLLDLLCKCVHGCNVLGAVRSAIPSVEIVVRVLPVRVACLADQRLEARVLEALHLDGCTIARRVHNRAQSVHLSLTHRFALASYFPSKMCANLSAALVCLSIRENILPLASNALRITSMHYFTRTLSRH